MALSGSFEMNGQNWVVLSAAPPSTAKEAGALAPTEVHDSTLLLINFDRSPRRTPAVSSNHLVGAAKKRDWNVMPRALRSSD
jgi:hypothetical protein